MLFDFGQQFLDAGHVSSHAAVKFNGPFAVESKFHIFKHLSVAEFHDQNSLGAQRGLGELFRRKWP